MARKADLGARIVALALHAEHLALAELVVKNLLAGGDAVRGFDLARRQGRGGVEIGVNSAVFPSGSCTASS